MKDKMIKSFLVCDQTYNFKRKSNKQSWKCTFVRTFPCSSSLMRTGTIKTQKLVKFISYHLKKLDLKVEIEILEVLMTNSDAKRLIHSIVDKKDFNITSVPTGNLIR